MKFYLRMILAWGMIFAAPWLLMQSMDIWIDTPAWLFSAIGTPVLLSWCIFAAWLLMGRDW